MDSFPFSGTRLDSAALVTLHRRKCNTNCILIQHLLSSRLKFTFASSLLHIYLLSQKVKIIFYPFTPLFLFFSDKCSLTLVTPLRVWPLPAGIWSCLDTLSLFRALSLSPKSHYSWVRMSHLTQKVSLISSQLWQQSYLKRKGRSRFWNLIYWSSESLSGLRTERGRLY